MLEMEELQFVISFDFPSCRSDEQRSEKHKLKKEKEIEKEVLEAEREDDGGFSTKVKLESLLFFSSSALVFRVATVRTILPHHQDQSSTVTDQSGSRTLWWRGIKISISKQRKSTSSPG